MSSGFGFKGREGRCYRFWKDVEQCSRDSEYSGECEQQVEDYLECLHHKKELTRLNAIAVQMEKNEAAKRYHGSSSSDEGHGH